MANWGWTTISGTSGSVLTTAEAKTQCGIAAADSSHDTFVASLVTAAVAMFEKRTRCLLLTRTLDLTLDSFPDWGGEITIPAYPLSSVTHVKYDNDTATDNVLSSALYVVSIRTMPPRITLIESEADWPDTKDQANQVRVRCILGYGAAASVPTEIKQSLLMLVSHWFESREAAGDRVLHEVPYGVDVLWKLSDMGDVYFPVGKQLW